MDFVTQFEKTLDQTISLGMYAQAEQLLSAYPSTGQPYSLKLYALINRLRQKTTISTQRIVLFGTGNFILNYIAKQFHSFFSQLNCDILFFDPDDYSKSTDALFTFAQNGIDAAYFFNNVGLLQTLTDGRNLWETLEIPCFDFLVDHPMYYADSLDYAPARTTLYVADQTHVSYVRRFYPRVQNAYFLPTGGCEIPSASESVSAASWAGRRMDVLFIGHYKFHADYQQDKLDEQITDYLITHTDHTFEQAVETCLELHHSPDKSPVSDEELKKVIENHRFLETNLTSLYRRTLIEKLLKAGIDIHVYGNGWNQTDLTNYPNLHLHTPVSFEEGISLMKDTKILLNHMAWFKQGSSERVFNAMAQGAVCFTDSSQYLDNILKDNTNCRLFSLQEILPNKDLLLAEKILPLLSDPDTASQIAVAGQKTASLHTWQKHLHCGIINQ